MLDIQNKKPRLPKLDGHRLPAPDGSEVQGFASVVVEGRGTRWDLDAASRELDQLGGKMKSVSFAPYH